MGDILYAIFGGVVLILLSLLGIKKGKTKRERKAKERAEAERDTLEVIKSIYQEADKIKDDLVVTQKDNKILEKEVIKSIEEIPQNQEVELSDEVKKLAADQSDRARARNKRMSNKGR